MKRNSVASLALAVGMALLIVSNSVHAGLFSASRAELSQELLDAHKSDLDGLVQAWIVPLTSGNGINSTTRDVMKDTAAIVKGFERFCSASGGRSTTTTVEFGANQSCMSAEGEVIGQFAIVRHVYGSSEWWITVGYESPAKRRAEKMAANEFSESLSRNGPTGWVETADGRYRVLRFGTLDHRSLLDVDLVPIEGVRHLDYVDCCTILASFMSGETRRINAARLGDGTTIGSHIMGWQNISMVLVDSARKPYVRNFNGGIKSIDIDPAGTREPMAHDGVIESVSLASSAENSIPAGTPSPECMSAQMACQKGSSLCMTYQKRFTLQGSSCSGVN